MASLGEIVVIAQGMRSQFGPDTRQMLAKEIGTHLQEGDAETAKFWQRVVDAMSSIEVECRGRSLETSRAGSRHAIV